MERRPYWGYPSSLWDILEPSCAIPTLSLGLILRPRIPPSLWGHWVYLADYGGCIYTACQRHTHVWKVKGLVVMAALRNSLSYD